MIIFRKKICCLKIKLVMGMVCVEIYETVRKFVKVMQKKLQILFARYDVVQRSIANND